MWTELIFFVINWGGGENTVLTLQVHKMPIISPVLNYGLLTTVFLKIEV